MSLFPPPPPLPPPPDRLFVKTVAARWRGLGSAAIHVQRLWDEAIQSIRISSYKQMDRQEILILSADRASFYLLIVSIIQSERLEIAVKSSLFGCTPNPVALFWTPTMVHLDLLRHR